MQDKLVYLACKKFQSGEPTLQLFRSWVGSGRKSIRQGLPVAAIPA